MIKGVQPGALRSGGAEPSPGVVLSAAIAGYGLFRVADADVQALRKSPGPVPQGWDRVPPSLLRYSDEQTVAGIAAVFTALRNMGAQPEGFQGWGVVAASRFVGRASLALALRRFDAEGVWGVSPHLIPHFALHSPAGTISLALGMHGPNLGVGGGLRSTTEGFLAALTWLAAGIVPGAWLVLSGWTPELVPDARGGPAAPCECQALALALLPPGCPGEARRFRIVAQEAHDAVPAPLDLSWLARCLGEPGKCAPQTIAADPSGRIRVELVPAAAEPPRVKD